ncbi:MAG: hypothetical protein ACI88A_001957 [Paraglaciecola sp.]|jgi:hypothetical protein
MHKVLASIFLIFISSIAFANVSSGVDIHVVKSKPGEWKLSYKTEYTVKRLGFMRNPDQSRIERWQPISDEFTISYIDGEEYILRRDGKNFSEVQLTLTPTYKNLSKDYAPFSPFSDGGMLFYSGRFFACMDSCGEETNSWNISLTIPDDEHIIVNGKVHTSFVRWQDNDSGKNIYVGKQKPIVTGSVITVIDSGLPKEIKLSLNNDIPKLMTYFEQRLGKLDGDKPTLFASYAKVDGTSSQGGTLPNQIFMHWNSNNLESKVSDEKFIKQTIWFFAHEVAHLYQRSSSGQLYAESNQSWMHEGNADYLASLALLDLYPESQQYIDTKIDRFRSQCIKGLERFPLIEAAEKGEFGLYYTCGLFIHSAIDSVVKSKSNSMRDVYFVWNEFRNRVEKGAEIGDKTFLSVVEEYASKELSELINKFVEQKLKCPAKALDKLAQSL